MKRESYDRIDALSGALIFLLGLAAFIASLTYRMGNIAAIGPGIFPAILGALLMTIGIMIGATAFRSRDAEDKPPTATLNLRAVLCVGVAMTGFAFGMRWFGLIPAIVICVVVARFSERRFGPVQTPVLALGLAIASWLIFVVGLNLPLRPFRMP